MEVNDETDRGVKMPKPFTLPGIIPAKLTKHNNMKLGHTVICVETCHRSS